MNVLNRLAKFASKVYRDGYMRTHVRSSIAYQVYALRKKLGLNQTAFADLTGKKQSVISRLENTDAGLLSVQTLLDIAAETNVALLVRFVSYPEFLRYADQMSEEELQPDTIYESLSAPIFDYNSAMSHKLVESFGSTTEQRPRVDLLRLLGSKAPQQLLLQGSIDHQQHPAGISQVLH